MSDSSEDLQATVACLQRRVAFLEQACQDWRELYERARRERDLCEERSR
jgi:hypothetical protein